MTKKKESTFDILSKVDVNEHKKKKGQFDYLSWPWAVAEMLKAKPEASWHVHEYEIDGKICPYMSTEAGFFVKVSVTIDGILRSQVHPVLDNRNQTIESPNAQEINKSIQRCLAKAIALHGLGLYIYAGEDLPEPDALNESEIKEVLDKAKGLDDSFVNSLKEKIGALEINTNNYEKCIVAIEKMQKEMKKGGSKK
tara:strand:+ start:553 stop:1140 length:588 start_codon:yes stop_codon:yes gene_type:complete